MDPVALGGLIVSVATLSWTTYRDWRTRKKDADIIVRRDGEIVVLKGRNLEEPEQAELFIREILSSGDRDHDGAAG